jgi:DNA polymerase-1
VPYRLLFDTESNGFVKNATKVHCMAAVDVDTGETLDWKPDQVAQGLEVLDKADTIIGHNIQRHDIPLLTKLKGWKPRPVVKWIDTMVCARLIYPNVKDTDGALVRAGRMPPGRDYAGKHTLGAWGHRLGEHKGDYAKNKEAEALALGIADPEAIATYVWAAWNEEMHAYMIQDVGTNLALWKHLKVDTYSQEAIELEHRIARVVDAMEQAGVPFDLEAAGALHGELVGKKAAIEKHLVEQFGAWYAPVSPDPVKVTFIPKRDNKKQGYLAGVPCTKIKRVLFNPGSRDHIAKVLLDRGWKPTEFTPGGAPQINDEVLSGLLVRFPEADGLAEYLMLEKRLSQLAEGPQAWLNHVGPDGHIHGVINPMGTTTSRASHFNPNLGQVPSMKKPYGKQCRALFGVNNKKGWKLVGADQEGLELRGLAHYLHPMDNGAYADVVCKGDPHWLHAQVIGLAEGERDKHNQLHTIVREDGSKRFIYAYIYGCFDNMAGTIIYNCLVNAKRTIPDAGGALYEKFFGNGDPTQRLLSKVGKSIREGFAKRIKGYEQLQKKLAGLVQKYGQLPGLDGRRIPSRSDHSALNFLIQSAGAIICKRWVVDAFDELSSRYKHGWDGDFVFLLWVHDEIQVAVREGLEKEVGEVLVRCARAAGEPYGFRVPLDSKYIVGDTWADTH